MGPDLAAGSLQSLHDGAPDPAGTARHCGVPGPRRPGGPARANVATSWENPCPGSLTAMLRTSLKRLPSSAPTAWSGTFQRGRVLEPQMDLCFAGGGGCPGRGDGARHGTSSRWGPRPRGARRGGCASRSRRHRRVPGRAGSKPRQVLPDVTADQHAGGIDGKGVADRPLYWPWSSSSASIRVSRSAHRLVDSPTSIRRRSVCQSSCLQPATVTDGARSTAWRSSASASGAGAASSCSSQIHSVPASVASAPPRARRRALSPARRRRPSRLCGGKLMTLPCPMPVPGGRRSGHASRCPPR